MAVSKSGHVKITRAEFTSKWWNEKRVFSKFEAWLDMYQLAQHEAREFTTTKFGTIKLERGEFILSLRKMAQRWGWGFQSVRSFTNSPAFHARLATQRETQAGTVYLILNYGVEEQIESKVTHPTTQPVTHLQHTSNTRTSIKELLTTTTTASGEAGEPKSNGKKPKAPPKYPDFSSEARSRLHKEWSMTKGPIAMSRFVAALAPLFPRYTLDQVSAAQSLAIGEAKAAHTLRFLTPETFAQNIVDYAERAAKEPVVDGWFADWSTRDAGISPRRVG